MLKNSINMTSQSIFIDNFTQKQNFCYSLLYFKNIEGITNQGQILDYYLHNLTFLCKQNHIYLPFFSYFKENSVTDITTNQGNRVLFHLLCL